MSEKPDDERTARTFVVWLSCGHRFCIGATGKEAEDLLDTTAACKAHGLVKVKRVMTANEYREELRREVATEPDTNKVWKAVEELFQLGIETNNIDEPKWAERGPSRRAD